MTTTSIGNHSKIIARHADQERIRAFYRGVLGGTLTKGSKEVDYIEMAGGFFLAVLYQEEVSSAEELMRSIWLELRTDDPVTMREKIVAFGVRQIEVPGAEHLYFQAPGGQVFRLVRNGEDLSKFEK
jgi:Glyoxalase-like domain